MKENFIPAAGFSLSGKPQYWWQNNRTLPFAIRGAGNVSPLSRYLEAHAKKDGRWAFGLWLREPKEQEPSLAMLPPDEIIGACGLVEHLIRPTFGDLEDLEWRIIAELVGAYGIKKKEVVKNAVEHPNGGTLWRGPKENFYLRRYFGGGLTLNVPHADFVPFFIEKLEITMVSSALATHTSM